MWGKYMLLNIKDGKQIKEIEAHCYGDALVNALAEMGFKVEAVENESKPIITATSPFPEVKEEKMEVAKGVTIIKDPSKTPFTAKALEIYNMLKLGPYTVEEMAQKTGTSQSTVKVIIYKCKAHGYIVEQTAMPGKTGVLYHIK